MRFPFKYWFSRPTGQETCVICLETVDIEESVFMCPLCGRRMHSTCRSTDLRIHGLFSACPNCRGGKTRDEWKAEACSMLFESIAFTIIALVGGVSYPFDMAYYPLYLALFLIPFLLVCGIRRKIKRKVDSVPLRIWGVISTFRVISIIGMMVTAALSLLLFLTERDSSKFVPVWVAATISTIFTYCGIFGYYVWVSHLVKLILEEDQGSIERSPLLGFEEIHAEGGQSMYFSRYPQPTGSVQ